MWSLLPRLVLWRHVWLTSISLVLFGRTIHRLCLRGFSFLLLFLSRLRLSVGLRRWVLRRRQILRLNVGLRRRVLGLNIGLRRRVLRLLCASFPFFKGLTFSLLSYYLSSDDDRLGIFLRVIFSLILVDVASQILIFIELVRIFTGSGGRVSLSPERLLSLFLCLTLSTSSTFIHGLIFCQPFLSTVLGLQHLLIIGFIFLRLHFSLGIV